MVAGGGSGGAAAIGVVDGRREADGGQNRESNDLRSAIYVWKQ